MSSVVLIAILPANESRHQKLIMMRAWSGAHQYRDLMRNLMAPHQLEWTLLSMQPIPSPRILES
jgi:hypothetical protein